jgi:cyclic pyranopterin monophosphate synthase
MNPPTRSTHFDQSGHAHMVDVSEKPISVRVAIASCQIRMRDETAAAIRANVAAKGDVLAVARLAGISATKQTASLIPLCHSIPIEKVSVEFEFLADEECGATETVPIYSTLMCRVEVRTSAKTGVEMEAMTGASIAGLTVYDMMKSVDRQMEIGPIRLESKSGGKSGNFSRDPD